MIVLIYIFDKDMKKILRKPAQRITPSHNYLKYWRIIRYWAKAKYGFSVSDLDMMLFLYSENFFNKKTFCEYTEMMSWDKSRFNKLLKDGYIHLWRKGEGKEADLYEVSYKGKRAISSIYAKLNGEEIGEDPRVNPLFKDDVKYMDKVYRNAISKLNKSIRQPQRHVLE